jgi:predicted ferric reductase
MTATASRLVGRAPSPRIWHLRPSDTYVLVIGNALVIAAMWLRHGGTDQLSTISGSITAIGQLTALLGTYGALLQLVLMSRSPWLDQVFGMDRLAFAHRWLGFATVWLLLGHGVGTTVGYALGDGSSVLVEAWTLLTTYPFVLMATVGMGLFIAVAVSSVRYARRRISYETWHAIHFYAYLAIALTFMHALVVGTDFKDDPIARIYWIGLYALAVGLIVAFRFGAPILLNLRHRLRIANVVQESPDTVSVYVTGRELDRLAVRAGQYFQWRFLAADGWWRAHPYSLSAAPNGEWLRITIKDLGDDSALASRLGVGTRVFAEGPYGVLTGDRRTRRRVLLLAGGIGVTPLRALLEELPGGPGDLALIYRAQRWTDVVFRDELDALARLRGATVRYLVGKAGHEVPAGPLSAAWLRRYVPDVAERDVYVCGPDRMMATVTSSLRTLRVPASQVHQESFAY